MFEVLHQAPTSFFLPFSMWGSYPILPAGLSTILIGIMVNWKTLVIITTNFFFLKTDPCHIEGKNRNDRKPNIVESSFQRYILFTTIYKAQSYFLTFRKG